MLIQKVAQKAFKLKCCNIQYKVNEEKGTVTAIEKFEVPFPLWWKYPSSHFTTIGIAKVNKEAGEEFNAEIGKKLARARAEKEAFVQFKLIALNYRKGAFRELQMVDNIIEKMNDCIQHQKEYIKSF